MRKWHWFIGLAGMAITAALPVVGHWARGTDGPRCSLDGGPISPIYRVRIMDQDGRSDPFCCIRCAELWLNRAANCPRAIYVTDEVSGQEIDSALAYFVRSSAITTPTTGNRIHVFREKSHAEKHAGLARGTVLAGPDRPFQLKTQTASTRSDVLHH